MSQNLGSSSSAEKEIVKTTSNNYAVFAALFFIIAIVGLFYVKWNPYYNKAFVAATKHSIGASIVSGKLAAAPVPSWSAAWGYVVSYFNAVWKAVILGLLLGSLVQVLIPTQWIKKVLGRKNLGSIVFGGVTALPGMMCSCCAAPVTVGLRKRSASVGASVAFFLGNPVLNPATIIFMGFVLSWKFAIYRVIIGVILVFGLAFVSNNLVNIDEAEDSLISPKEYAEDRSTIFSRWMKALGQLIIDTIPAYLVVVLLLGAFRAYLFPVLSSSWSNSVLAIILLAITGTLFVIPTAAEIPIIQTLMSFGMGVGPAAALLMVLPAVSLPSLLIVKPAFPKRILLFLPVAVAVTGIVSGLIALIIF
ncbi:permease [Clostridium sp. DJ247]|uniref:permease n=1 Tax=Clostridium sp. DJ247 TaxID=2726188 RepID=UPI0028BE2D4D|nr:permease [Clostridium sp. DJ247]